MKLPKLMLKRLLSKLYFYNYHSINIMACLIMLFFQNIVANPFINYMDTIFKYPLILMIILNIGLLIKCYITKTYTSLYESNKDIDQIIAFMLMFTFKIGITVLTLFVGIWNTVPYFIEITVNISTGLFIVLHSFFSLCFIYFGFYGLKNRINPIKIKNHWLFEFLTDKQIIMVKTYQEEGRVIGIYFKNFNMNEQNDRLTLRNVTIKLSSFRLYIESKKCKIDDLTDDDIAIMEMLSI